MPSLEFRRVRSEEHTSELQSHSHLVCRLLLEKKKVSSVRFRKATDCSILTTPKMGSLCGSVSGWYFFFNNTPTTEIYPLSLHDALPISRLNSSHTLISYAVFCLRDESVTVVQTGRAQLGTPVTLSPRMQSSRCRKRTS